MHRVNHLHTSAAVVGFESFVLVYSRIFFLCDLCDIYFFNNWINFFSNIFLMVIRNMKIVKKKN